jgi:hypothetical protein
MRLGQRFESARRLSFLPANPLKMEHTRYEHRGFVSSTSAVDYPKASSRTLVCYKWLQGTAGGVGDSSGIDRLTDVAESGWVRHRRSPEYREVEYCELRPNGVLGSLRSQRTCTNIAESRWRLCIWQRTERILT